MSFRLLSLSMVVFAAHGGLAAAQEKNDAKPLLRLEAGGPTSNVTSLAFSPDGKTLYVAGFDKVVRAWTWNAVKSTFELDDRAAFRVPIGPGLDGAINALALSDDGLWLAVGGFGVVAEGMKFNEAGRLIPSKGGLTPSMRADRGQIFVFNTRDRSVKTLRGHSGPVLSLTFARNSNDQPRLLSAAEGWAAAAGKANGEAKVWDVLKEKEIASREMAALTFARRPGLELIAGAGPQLNAYLAWEDGTLLRWDIAAKNATSMAAPKYDVALDFDAERQWLLTAGMEGAKGILQAIRLDGTLGPKFTLPGTVLANEFDLPIAARMLRDRQHVALIVRNWIKDAPRGDVLMIAGAPGAKAAVAPVTLPLGQGSRILPALSVSADHIAVGGFPDHRILVFAVKDAIAGKAAPSVLRSAGVTMQQVEFVKNGPWQGLALTEQSNQIKGKVVLDVTNGKLRIDTKGFVSDVAAADGYTLARADLKVTLSKANKVVSTATVREGEITAMAVAPPLAAAVPLVAVASYIPIKGTTLLELIDGASGQTIRRYVGHTAPIRGLSFRADGKLLASTADDQTTIVWSLTDLGEILGQHSGLDYLAVEARGKDLAVIDADGIKGFSEGDLVRGLYDKTGKLQPLATPAAFYEAVWMKKPGQTVKFQVSRAGKNADVNVALHQGVDFRKPLFTLFFPRDAAGKLGDWLGWNAIGPYDSSRKEVEQYLGWHFNTGKADQPTSFAFIDQYRKEYFRPGLLKEMAELGDLPPAPKGPPPKPALLAPGVAEEGVLLASVAGEYLIRKKTFELHVTIPAYEPFDGDKLTWQMDGGPERPLEPADVNLWSAKVELPAGSASTRNVVIRMKRTPEGWPAQDYRKDLTLRIVAPPPTIALDAAAKAEPIKVEKAAFPFKATFQPGEAGVAYRATFAQELLGRKIVSRDLKSDKAGELTATLMLEPGLNVIQVRAVNDRAVGRPHEDDEAATASIKVLYEPRKIPPPSIAFTQLLPEKIEDRIKITGRTVRYQSAKSDVNVGYTVKSEEPIAALEYEVVPGGKRQPLPIPANDKSSMLALKLTPGVQTLRVFLKTETGVPATAEQEIDFRPPPLTQPVIANLEEGFVVSGTGDRFETPLEVRFAPLNIDFKLPVTVEANIVVVGKTIGQTKAVVDASTGAVKFDKVALAHGSNTIQVRLRHEFSGDDRVAEINGRYVRPPKIASLTAAVGKTPFADVTANVESVIPPSAEFVAVTVNGKLVRPASIDVKKGERGWIVEAKQTPLAAVKGKDAKSDISLTVTTSDGDAQASLKEPIVFSLPLPPAPDIAVLEPARDATLSEPTMKVRFKVTSEAPPALVEIVRGDKPVKRWESIQATADGVYEFTLADVPLDYGVNSLTVLARNEGGVRGVPLNVNVPPQPVRLDLDHIEVPGLKFNPEKDGDFSPMPVGRVVLHGSVRWTSNDDTILQLAKQVRLFVNGFQQLPVELKPVAGKPRERRFQVPVVLNFAENQIEVDLPDLKQDASNRRRITIGCRQPIRGQHLHVLVIAPQEKDETKLIDNLTRGIKAQPIGSNLYKTPVFDVVRLYVLAKHVQLLEISSRLDRIAESLKERARAGNPNDLVMIYFQGKETVDANGPVLWTSESAPWLQLTLKDLSKNYLSRFSGGQVLILDTVSQAGPIDFRDARFAFMRRPDPRPLADAARLRLSVEIAKEMPNVVWLDQLTTVLAAQEGPSFQHHLPEPLRNRIQLNPN